MEEFEWPLQGLTLRGTHRAAQGVSQGTIVTIHGWLDSGASFIPLAQALPEYDWYLLDLPGHGHSDWMPAGLFYHFIDSVAFVCEALKKHISGPATLVAHSMGAAIAPLVAAALPDKIERLFLIDGLGPISTPESEAPEILRKSIEQLGTDRPPRNYPELQQLAVAMAESRKLTFEQSRPLLERGTRQTAHGWELRHDPRLKWTSRQRFSNGHIEAFLRSYGQPTLVIVPHSGFFPKYPEWRERLQWLPEGSALEMPGGHHVHLETPGLVAEMARKWFRENDARKMVHSP